MHIQGAVWWAVMVVSTGCAGISATQRKAWETAAAPAVTALQAAKFDEATQLARGAVSQDPANSGANAALAVSLYRKAIHDLVSDTITLGGAVAMAAIAHGGFISTEMLVDAFRRADERLAEVDGRLEVAAADPEVSLELCLACWEVDWNRSGEIDERDRALFQIEQDAQGHPLPPEDPRRRPTYRFDVSDVHWLKALVAFQRAAINLAQAWDWAAIAPVFIPRRGEHKLEEVHIPLRDAEQVKKARGFILAGVAESRLCRAAALAETDDDREWLPNPRQKNYAMPLEVDDALYTTWAQVLDDVDKLVRDEEAISVTELAQLGKHQWADPPKGYLHVGKWLAAPREIVVPMTHEGERDERVEHALQQLFGDAYSQLGPSSGLPARMQRMKAEVGLGRETFEKKLRYLLWVN